eukprot:TRINITY_DN50920_c0_g1_i1.p2 TRINITY_DN50920_c0_g1~~TRINITY_DN50920_c0_g1_i1.p2  ORF type:complete len:292 (+),score=128.23 TRINITY_DN50920_c0_g1_i1:85-960(+)
MVSPKKASPSKASPQKQGTKRPYEDISVETLSPPQLVVVENPSQRFTKWERMRITMLKAIGKVTGDEAEDAKTDHLTADPAVELGEHCYVVARTEHPQKPGTMVCLVEKSLEQGYLLMPESALDSKVEGLCAVAEAEQQYSTWAKMEEHFGIKISQGFKAPKGLRGYVLAKAPHPKQADLEVAAVMFPPNKQRRILEKKYVIIKAAALRDIPTECVRIADPAQKLSKWPAMAEALGITEKDGAKVVKDALGIPRSEAAHLKKEGASVVAVEMMDGTGTVMMMKTGLRYIKA